MILEASLPNVNVTLKVEHTAQMAKERESAKLELEERQRETEAFHKKMREDRYAWRVQYELLSVLSNPIIHMYVVTHEAYKQVTRM